MEDDLQATGRAYLKAWDAKDIDGIASYLHPEVHFIGPMAEVRGKQGVVESAKRMFGIMRGLKVRSEFVSGEEAMFTYDFVCAEPIGVCRTAERVVFKDGLIREIELFFDARPFEKMMQSRQPASA
jgi:hypothetical protein